MLIRFGKNDPRAGSTARMDSIRGQQLIDSGAAVEVKEGEAETSTVDTASTGVTAPAKPAKKAAAKKAG